MFSYEGSSWSWSHGSWIYNYVCNQCMSSLKLWVRIQRMTRCDRYNIMWSSLSVGRWFSPGTLVSFTNKTDRHDITEILLKVALNTIILTLIPLFVFCFFVFGYILRNWGYIFRRSIFCSRENNIASVTKINSDHPFTGKYHRIWNNHNQLDWKKQWQKSKNPTKPGSETWLWEVFKYVQPNVLIKHDFRQWKRSTNIVPNLHLSNVSA